MARPRKENADYFSHDTNMRSHRKIIALRNKYWLHWYAIYCMLLEHIAWSDFFTAKWNDIEKEIIAGDFSVPVAELVDIVSFCDRLGLVQIDWEYMRCQSLTDRLSILVDKRDRERNRVSVAETTQVVAESPHSKVKESKVKEKKINNKEIISKDTTIVEWYNPDPITISINNIISELKNKMNDYWIVYSWEDERMFGKHILSKKRNKIASQYKFSNWIEFAKFIIDCSMQDWNWRKYKVCSIKLLYQKYAQIINSYQEAKDKKSNIASSF